MSSRLVALSVFGAAWLALCIWTARRLLSGEATRRRVLGWGVPSWLVLAAWQWVDRADGALFSPWGLAALGVALFVGFPIAMWTGHVLEGMFTGPPVRRSGRGEA